VSDAPRRELAAVVVPTLDRPEFLGECLRSIADALGPSDELVVVEAGDSQAGRALEELDRRATLVPVAGRGKSRQVNSGVARSSAPIIVFTDDDCRVEPGWVDALVGALDDARVGIAFGPVRGLTHAPASDEVAPPPPGPAPFVTWTYAHGASFAVRRKALADIGGFDERLGPGAPAHGEEHDVLLRLRARGWLAVVADAPPVVHLDWRSEDEGRANALVYERGAGAFLGAAMRRDRHEGWPLLKQRLGYQRQLLRDRSGRDRRFAWRAAVAFVGGFAYGIRLPAWKGTTTE
jgi:GT2 family glycosyltransferase